MSVNSQYYQLYKQRWKVFVARTFSNFSSALLALQDLILLRVIQKFRIISKRSCFWTYQICFGWIWHFLMKSSDHISHNKKSTISIKSWGVYHQNVSKMTLICLKSSLWFNLSSPCDMNAGFIMRRWWKTNTYFWGLASIFFKISIENRDHEKIHQFCCFFDRERLRDYHF